MKDNNHGDKQTPATKMNPNWHVVHLPVLMLY
jgi:hypothetical protein